MNDDKLPATASKSEARDATRDAAQRGEFEQTGRRAATRTVGVYDRPTGRARLSLPLLLLMILAALVSVVVTARFLF
jgi:hypothetical protein